MVFTLSLLTTFYNTEMFEAAGIKEPPKDWDELKRMAKDFTKDGKYGWVLNYGAPEGIGGVASYWMAYLQQAGGKLYAADGTPDFNNPAGVDSLQLMVDLMESTDPGSISYVGINDATNVFSAGNAAMMLNWPFMWKPANDPETSKIAGKVGAAINAAGPGRHRLDRRHRRLHDHEALAEPGGGPQAHRVLPGSRGPEEPGDRHGLAPDPSVRAQRPRGPGEGPQRQGRPSSRPTRRMTAS